MNHFFPYTLCYIQASFWLQGDLLLVNGSCQKLQLQQEGIREELHKYFWFLGA